MILHLSTFHLEGGAGVAATRLHRALRRAGADSEMLVSATQQVEEGVMPLAGSKWQKRLGFARFVGERLSFLPHEKDRSVRFAFSPAQMGSDISTHPLVRRAEILHFHWFNFGFLSLHSLDRLFALGKPMVWTLHDMWAFTGGCHYNRGCDHFLTHCRHCPYLSTPDLYDLSFTQFEKKKKLYENGRLALVSPSRWLNDHVQKAALTGGLQALSIPNCIDTDIFKPIDKTAARRHFHLPENKKLVLFAGANTQDPRKGFYYFKEALNHLKSQFPDTEVMVFGKAGTAVLDDFPVKVHYLGKLETTEALVNAYNAADLLAAPSMEDNLPNTIMEAMACGTPVAGFETGGIPEMIDHEHNGYVAVAGSSLWLAEGISWILAHNENGTLSAHARRKVMQSYAGPVVAARYQELYTSLLP